MGVRKESLHTEKKIGISDFLRMFLMRTCAIFAQVDLVVLNSNLQKMQIASSTTPPSKIYLVSTGYH